MRMMRLLATGSPRTMFRAARRELVWRRHEATVARAARRGDRLLAGPFLGEVGYELLYWIPALRRLLAEHEVERERVTVLARGGAAVWYRDLAADAVEVLDLLPSDDYLPALVERRRGEGGTKQFFPGALDSRLIDLALERVGKATVVHPLLVYSRLRFLLEGLQAPEQALYLADYRRIRLDERPLPGGCPDDYVAVKLYFSDPFPDCEPSRQLAAEVLERVAAESDVVVLSSGVQLDEHREWVPDGPRVHDASRWVTPRDNLAVQSAILARARAFVCTYGGFSYLGPMLAVPTLALQIAEVYNPTHLAVLRLAFPEADYALMGPGEVAGAERFAARLADLAR
jgi:hypothetical protein